MNKKLFIKFMVLIVLLIGQITLCNNFVSASAYPHRLSDKGAYTLLKQIGFNMDVVHLHRVSSADEYVQEFQETLQYYGMRVIDKSQNTEQYIYFLCDSNGYPIVCGIGYSKNNITGMMAAAHLLIYYFQEAYIRNGQYLNEQIYRAITQGVTTDYPFPEINAIYYFRGFNPSNSDYYRLIITRSPR